jgi:hypothetical protein
MSLQLMLAACLPATTTGTAMATTGRLRAVRADSAAASASSSLSMSWQFQTGQYSTGRFNQWAHIMGAACTAQDTIHVNTNFVLSKHTAATS